MRNLEELNYYYGAAFADHSAPTRDQVVAVEALMGARLPPACIDILMFSNGGYPGLDTFPFFFEGEESFWRINEFLAISSDPESTVDVRWNYHHRWPLIPETMLPIAADALVNLVCLDLSQDGYGSVTLCVHDPPDPPVLLVAESFEQFVDSLEKGPHG